MQIFTQWIISRKEGVQSMLKRNILLPVAVCFMSVSSIYAQTVTLKPVKDSWIVDDYPANNYGNTPELVVASWTTGGDQYNCRSFLEFDLSSIPANAVIKSAVLRLATANPSSIAPAGNKGDNRTYIQRLSSPWTEAGLTWANQPIYTETDQVNVAPTSSEGHIFNIDVTAMTKPMHADPSQNFGYRMVLQEESVYRNFALVSKEGADASLHPTLTIVYQVSVGVADAKSTGIDVSIFPNPGSGIVTISGPSSFKGEITTISGQSVYSFESAGETATLDVSGLSKGLYLVRLDAGEGTAFKKLVIE